MAIGNLFGTGGESNSLYGTSLTSNGASSFIYFEWFIFKVSTGQPTTPTGGSWDFATNTGTPPTGWTSTVTGVPINNLWFSIAFVDSRNPTNIVWSAPGLLAASTSVYATAYADTFTGNGSTVNWTLTTDPVVVNNLDVSINGVTQTPTVDYTISGTTFTTTTAAPLGSIILVKYRQALPNSYFGTANNVGYTPFSWIAATNVQAALNEVATDISATDGVSGSNLVGYKPVGTGAVANTVQAKLREWISIADFIPLGTNTEVTDCAPYLQAAINAGGGSVFIPEGVYRMATQVVLPVNNFYTLTPGNQIFSQGAELIVETTTPLFTQNVGTDYTSKWFFHDLSFTSSTVNSKVFDMDRIYNSIFMNNVFVGITSVFWSRVDRSGSPSYPYGYIQSAYITNNHFASCGKGIDAKRAFNLDVSNNYFEGCDTPVAVDGTGDPACNQIRITNNVMEGGSGTPIILGAVFGGLIQGNYFEANSGAPSCDIKMDVVGAAYHRGLVINANSFQPTTAQKADTGWSNIKIDKVISAGRGPVVTGNTTSGPRIIDGIGSGEAALLSGNYEAVGENILDKYPIPGQTSVKFASIRTGFLNNRATAYNGAGVWEVLTIDDIIQSTVYDFNGFLNLYNIGGNLVGATQVSLKFRVFIDVQGVLTAAMVGSLQLEELTGARNIGGDPLYSSYWGSVTPTFTVSGSSVTVLFNTFNDYSVPTLGEVYSLGPSFSVVVSTGDPIYSPTNFSMP